MCRLGAGLCNKSERTALHSLLSLFAIHMLVHLCPDGSLLLQISDRT